MKLVVTCQPYYNIFNYDGEPKIRENQLNLKNVIVIAYDAVVEG
jgi:hypothetical protein